MPGRHQQTMPVVSRLASKTQLRKMKHYALWKKKPQINYTMQHMNETKLLKKSNQEKDVGILISNDLKWCAQVTAAT
jgi:hypothetical protein